MTYLLPEGARRAQRMSPCCPSPPPVQLNTYLDAFLSQWNSSPVVQVRPQDSGASKSNCTCSTRLHNCTSSGDRKINKKNYSQMVMMDRAGGWVVIQRCEPISATAACCCLSSALSQMERVCRLHCSPPLSIIIGHMLPLELLENKDCTPLSAYQLGVVLRGYGL